MSGRSGATVFGKPQFFSALFFPPWLAPKKKTRFARFCRQKNKTRFARLSACPRDAVRRTSGVICEKWICVISSAANRIFPGNLRNIFQYLNFWKKSCLHTQKSQMRHQTLLEIHIYINLTVLATSEWIYLNTMWNLSLVPSQNENNEALVLLRISDLGKILNLKIWWHTVGAIIIGVAK